MESIIQVLFLTIVQMIDIVGIFIVVGFILGLLEKYSNTFLRRAYGEKGILWTALIGTPIHEIGHLLMCLIFKHRVTKVKFFQRNDPNGVLGYVEHSYHPGSLYQRIGNFFIGIGPIFSGIGAIMLSMYLLVPNTYQAFLSYLNKEMTAGSITKETIQTTFNACWILWNSLFSIENIQNPLFWLFLVLSISISSHIALSPADIQELKNGCIAILVLLLFFNLVGTLMKIDTKGLIDVFTMYNAYWLAFSSIAIFFSCITLAISFILYKMKSNVRRLVS